MIISNPMNILFISAEVAPFSKAGGLADVAGSLPKAIRQAGIDLTVVSPLYGIIDTSIHTIIQTDIQGSVQMGANEYEYTLWETKNSVPGLQYLFIQNSHYFDRKGIYTNSNGEGFEDNNARFFFLQSVILDLLKQSVLSPDILHCNDHHSALLPLMLKTEKIDIPSILTVHNFLYQGHFGEIEVALLPQRVAEYLSSVPKKEYRTLYQGIKRADMVNTVSPNYAMELLAGKFIEKDLADLLIMNRGKFQGILNGVDYDYWNPACDILIPFNFDLDNMGGKKLNKRELRQASGLDLDNGTPLIASVSRLVENKGFPLIIDILDDFVDLGAQFVFLGSGMPEYCNALHAASIKYPGRVAFFEGFNEPMAHLIEAGSDIFLMPSEFEPCGLNQIYSLKYGTIPVVHDTGGLSDTVEHWDGNEGTGFLFNDYTATGLTDALRQAVDLFRNFPMQWTTIVKNAMVQDFSWQNSANQYISLYKNMLGKPYENE